MTNKQLFDIQQANIDTHYKHKKTITGIAECVKQQLDGSNCYLQEKF